VPPDDDVAIADAIEGLLADDARRIAMGRASRARAYEYFDARKTTADLIRVIAEARDRHGVAVVFDGHTIRSRVARFFAGQLPDLNLGTAKGASVAPDLGARVFAILDGSGYGAVRDQRFTGGYITRSYGRPAEGAHVLQLELTWRTYMEEGPPYAYLPDRAGRLKAVLRAMLESGMDWALARG
jgi:N-formylglutamate amidohydrolase